MLTVRPPAVAGTFYPGLRKTLLASVDELLHAAKPKGARPKALVVPHAGYVYSGPIAASAYAQLQAPWPTRVVLLGPSHFEPLHGLALPGCTAFETPLGVVPVDTLAKAVLQDLPFVVESSEAHAHEHSLEVQLPFLQRVLAAFSVVPLAVGRASVEQVAQVLKLLWGGDETLIVISTDLSHYLPYAKAQEIDARTARLILAADASLGDDQACGASGLRGLLTVAKNRGLRAAQLDLRNSGDTAYDRSRVVGYGAFAFYEQAPS